MKKVILFGAILSLGLFYFFFSNKNVEENFDDIDEKNNVALLKVYDKPCAVLKCEETFLCWFN